MLLEDLTGEINYFGSLLSFDNNTFSFDFVGAGQNAYSVNDVTILVDNAVINGSVV